MGAARARLTRMRCPGRWFPPELSDEEWAVGNPTASRIQRRARSMAYQNPSQARDLRVSSAVVLIRILYLLTVRAFDWLSLPARTDTS
jgi:hypothetical protein